jgi:hypothetical protein
MEAGRPDREDAQGGARTSWQHALQAALLALQGGQNLPLPALLDALDPRRRDVDRHPILEPLLDLAEAPRHIEPDLLHNRGGVVERGGGPE